MLSAPRCLRQRLAQTCHRQRSQQVNLAGRCQLRPFHRARVNAKDQSHNITSVKKVGSSNVSASVRREELKQHGFKDYPRMNAVPCTITDFRRKYEGKDEQGHFSDEVEYEHLVGRVQSVRKHGSKLAFVTIAENAPYDSIQITLNEASLQEVAVKFAKSSTRAFRAETEEASAEQIEDSNSPPRQSIVKSFVRSISKGDFISVAGKPHLDPNGNLVCLGVKDLQLLSPCIHPIPENPTGNDADIATLRHAQQIANPELLEYLHKRSIITTAMQSYLLSEGFLSVQTPILAATAGGASARPFETTASEFGDRQLSLRIAPELWLKKLMVGGMKRIFEMGPSFRNEGIDPSHNPEFTTCEFYSIDWSLQRMMYETQDMFHEISQAVGETAHSWQDACGPVDENWPEIDFIPALNEALGVPLPDLSSPDAREKVLDLYRAKGVDIPTAPTLPRLLDHLSSVYLEPQCDQATWIVNTPECLSPLAKSHAHPDLPHQKVAIRAELFIGRKEVVNCYEEENDPKLQYKKLEDQQRYARPDGDTTSNRVDQEAMRLDREYCSALEWGLPPIGGWGCGIDRLVMLMLGLGNIRDVLSFGNLRMVTRGADKAVKTRS